MSRRPPQLLTAVVVLAALVAGAPLHAAEIARANLDILGLGLEVDRQIVTTAVDVPANVQTIFGGKTNDNAPEAPGLSAIGELTGPGILTPITLAAVPGHRFSLPALHEKGEYSLQNIRLVGESGEFLQQAVPSFATIIIEDVLKTEVRARQLTPQELRERGITVDSRNFDVYEYTIVLGVGANRVEVPYPVIIDRRTHAVEIPSQTTKYKLPPLTTRRPPRVAVPSISHMSFGGFQDSGAGDRDQALGPAPSIPAAIVLPSGFGVLHQFFAVILQVSNGASDASNIRIDSINASISVPQQMRMAKVTPAVTLGQPVPITDAVTGATFLVAGAQGSAEWTLEALKTGTHTMDVTIEGVYQKPGQADFPLRGHASTSVIVSDPRFQINFSHPDVVRVDEGYTAYAFVTNLSSQAQHVVLDMTLIPDCTAGGDVDNVCRVEGTGLSELDIQPGEMISIPYKLKSKITGNVFAAAGSATDEAIGVSVKLTMGVSESGIPLSPATLVMPHYARYLPGDFIAANMQLLGLGYSLATAPLNQYTAKFPRLITTDVFQRAQDITRAGQRIFVTRSSPEINDPEENRDAFTHLALDLLGNIERLDQIEIAPEMIEWDELRRMEKSGRRAGAAMARQLEIHGLHNNRTPQQFVDDFAAATAHRSPFFFAYAHGADVAGQERPYALSLLGVNTNRKLDVPAEATTGWVRTLGFSELTRFDAGSERGEMALLGRVSENIRVLVTPRASSFTLHLIYPDTADGAFLRSDIDITGATPGQAVWIDLARGWRTPVVNGASGNATVHDVPQTPLRVVGAAQDLHLNSGGHLVSILFNRPLYVADVLQLRDRLALTTTVTKANYTITRRNTPTDPEAELQIPSAALQEDGKLLDITFDKALSTNGSYTIAVDGLSDLVTRSPFSDAQIVPRIDNNRPGGILTGRVLNADNTPVPKAVVRLVVDTGGPQIDLTDANGRFLYEFVERDIDRNINGSYQLAAAANGRGTTVKGAVRLVGEVHTVNLVFLGRGTVRGFVRYDDGTPVSKAILSIGSALQSEHVSGFANEDGSYELTGVAVGPITVLAREDSYAARTAYATNMIRTASEVVTQDLVIFKRESRGSGTVRLTVRRADNNEVVSGARTLVQTSGYPLDEAETDEHGFVEYRNVPAGLVTFLAERFEISLASYAAIEADLRADQVLEQTVILPTPTSPASSNFSGVITRDDPTAPADRSKDQLVPGAVIQIGYMPSVTAGADGSYVYPNVPQSIDDNPNFRPRMLVFDPVTGRKGQFDLPSLLEGDVHYSVRLSSTAPEGYATVRVRLTSATGAPVIDYRVIDPGFPPKLLTPKPGGVYELTDVPVPSALVIAAVPKNPNGLYGDQMASGNVRVDFNGQVAILDLRLPGQGNVVARVQSRQADDACTVPPCYSPAPGRAAIQYPVWDEFEQHMGVKTKVVEADLATQLNTFQGIPAKRGFSVYTMDNVAGFAAATDELSYDGDIRSVTLSLESIGDVTGRVFAHDRQTPMAGALVKLENGAFVYGSQLTKPDGSFRFPAVPANLEFRVVAETSRDGIYRTGVADGRTPLKGGPVSNLVVVMREQSSIEGQVVDTDGQPVPLAYFWARELWWPNRAFGSPGEPLQADINGRFILQNIFSGPFRITAKSPVIQEVRGDYQGTIGFEGDTSQLNVKVEIGGAGTGTLSISVVDSLQAFKPIPNAEVTIYRGSNPFDVSTTDDRGIVEFHDVVAGTYSVGAFSKTVGRAGRVDSVTIVDGETTTRQIALEFLGKVSGNVTDPESVPAPNGPARGVAVQVDSRVPLRETTDTAGEFSMLGVPEGPFSIFAYDFETGRMAFGPQGLFISKIVQEHNGIHLDLEKMATLHVKVYLPNDVGGPGELAPLAAISVEATDYLREQQGNNLAFPQMIPRYPYKVVAKELGGEQRTVVVNSSFPPNTFDHTQTVVFPSFGSVEVKVLDGLGLPVSDVEVYTDGRTIFTAGDGIAYFTSVPFGPVWVQARKGAVGSSASGTVASRSGSLKFVLNLGSSAGIKGFVEAETGVGVPSVGTRVVVNVTSSIAQASRLEAITGPDGAFLFSAVPIGSTQLSFLYYGPDDTTIGAERVVNVPNGTTGTFTVPPVKLDATPPRVLTIDPPANANDVSPSSNVVVTFSEPIAASFLSTGYFQLISTDDNAQVGVTFQPSIRPDGTFQVKLIPPAPPAGQRFPLESNVLYRVVVNAGIQDTTGNALRTTVGSTFTTVNYTEPSVVRLDPAADQPLPSNATLRIKFNKAVDITSLDPGYGGVLTLAKLTTRGGTPVRSIPLSRFLDPVDPSVIVAGVAGESLEEASFYRLTVSGIRDTQTPPNVQVAPKIYELFSFDTKRPIATIVSPVAAGEKLVSDVLYTAQVNVVDEISGATSTDIDSVDWFDANGQFLRRVLTPPYGYTFVAPGTTTGTTYTLKVSANDLSGNSSPTLEAFTWDVLPNAAPANVNVTNTPTFAYPTQAGSSTVTFADEGVQVTVALELHAKRLDNSDLVQIFGSKAVTRASTTAAWSSASFNYTLPLDLQPGTAQVVAKVTDLSKTGTGQAALEILNDNLAPEVVSFLPVAETHYPFDATYPIELKVRDDQTGVKSVTFSIGGTDVPAAQIQHTVANGLHTYLTTARVSAKNADTRIAIVARALDNRDNLKTSTSEVIYERVDDSRIPQAAWISPLDQAAMPFGIAGWQATLRVRATDDSEVTSVEFVSDAFASPVAPVTTPKSGTTDIFEAKATFTLPANGAPFVVTALVHDVDPNHTVELPITLRPVVLDPNVAAINTSSSISSITAPQYDNKPLVVRGAGTRATITVRLHVKDLIVLDGASVSTFEETALDLTITDHLFVDADSSIDVSDKGYLGAHRVREDNVLRNDTNNGRTLSAATGATNDASGSHAGIGGEGPAAITNATYGSITTPRDFGSGGAGNSAAGNGGGAALLSGAAARFVVAGAIVADGGSGVSRSAAGSGGTVSLDAQMLITGPLTRITANGGDEDSLSTGSNGGGGGRIAVRVAGRFDAAELESRFRAHGGRNGAADGTQFIDGGAGTFFLSRPAAALGEVIVSSFDARQPSSTHRTRGTVLTGTLAFDAITVGPRALARIDNAHTTPIAVDATATVVGPTDVPQVVIVSTIPDANGQVAQSTNITPTFNAHSLAGITRARVVLTAQPVDTIVNLATAPASVPDTQAPISIPATATTGTTTLKLVVTDRAGRTAESTPVAFSIVSNAVPVIDTFVVTPSDQIYAGGTINVSGAASDDIEVKSLTLASSIGTVTSQTATKPTPQSMARLFSVALPKTTPSGTSVALTLTASDDFPNRIPTSAQHNIAIRRDDNAPVFTITKPTANQDFDEIANATFTIEVSATDAEVGVNTVKATFEGTQYTLQPVAGQPGLYSVANVPIPAVDGTEPVAKSITIAVTDFEPNTAPANVTIFVKPLVDPNAPRMNWVCSSPSAMYPAGYAAPLRVFADGSSAQNGVQRVEFTVDGGAPITATETSAGSKEYQATFAIPPGATAGAVYNIRAAAFSTSGNEASLLGTITVVGGFDINTASEIAATDLAFENLSLIVRSGGVLTVTGPHTFANLVVLDGGKVVQKHLDIRTADAMTVTRLYVACNASIDVSGLGFAKNTTYSGAGNPADASGGSHIGRGGLWSRQAGGTFGSVYRPREGGGGGQMMDPSYPAIAGGGSVRIHASSAVAIDGAIRSRVTDHFRLGSSAGGSVWITTPSTLSGAGSIDVTGGSVTTNEGGAGGGGNIALEYASASGTLLSRLVARGGTGNLGRHGGAGSIYLKSAAALFGDLVIDNKNVSLSYGVTDLPSFGRVHAASVNGASIELDSTRWLAQAMVGHSVRVFAADGSVRGTWRIESIANDASTTPVNGFFDVPTQDAFTYDGYLYYSPAGIGGRRFVAVRYVSNRWEYDDDATFTPFTPQEGEGVIASFRKDAPSITELVPYRCAPTCGAVNGVPMLELSGGEIVPNALGGGDGTNKFELGLRDNAELFLRADGRARGLVVSKGVNATITLEPAAVVQTGDVLRGVYRFDSITLTNARVMSEDLVESATAPVVDATSSLATGNADLPVVYAAAISIARGLDGPIVVGAAGAVNDPSTPIHVVARNLTHATAVAPIWNATAAGQIVIGTRGGVSVQRAPNGTVQANGVSTLNAITSSGFASFSASQTNQTIVVGLAPNDTTVNSNEPGPNGFKLLANGTYELWANGASVNKNGAYTTATVFRIEKTPLALSWFVDGVLVHEVTAAIPQRLVLDLSFESALSGEIHSIDYDTTSASDGLHRAAVDVGGSFRVPVLGQPGDAVALFARDGHTFMLASDEVQVATIGNDIGVESVTFAPAEVTGGRTAIGTVTLKAPAGADGARVVLSSNNAVVTIPAKITVAAGQTTGTFNAATQPVASPVDISISATYGGIGTSGALHIVKDNVNPAVTITVPAAGAQYTEGAPSGIPVEVVIVEEDSGLAQATATIDGVSTNLTRDVAKGPNVYAATLAVPFVEGTSPVSKTITVNAVDNNANPGSATVAVTINPVIDANAPSLTWSCFSSGGMYLVGDAVTLRVTARPPNATNTLQRVEFIVTDPSSGTTTLAANALPNDEYQESYTVPAVADGATFQVRVRATAVSGSFTEETRSFLAVANAVKISATTTIAANDTSYDGKSVIVTAGTTTIAGAHTFKRLIVYSGANVTHAAGDRLDVQAENVFVACGGTIDATGKGYANTATYPGEQAAGDLTGGSHIGRGGLYENPFGTTYGSVTRPQEAGAGARGTNPSGVGGGVLRINAASVIVDGAIRANGAEHAGTKPSGAGGSVWITSTRIAGTGAIETNGGRAYHGIGGGGAISIESTDATSTLPALSSRTGVNLGEGRYGGAGSIFVKGSGSTYGDLTIDNGGLSNQPTILPSLGKGTAQSGTTGATLVTDRATSIPAFFIGHWIEIYAPNGTLKGTWRIETIPAAKTVVLAPNASETISLAQGDTWQGVYRFDNMKAIGIRVESLDPIRVAGTQTIEGTVEIEQVSAAKLLVKGTLQASTQNLVITADEVRVETGGAIDASGKGYVNTGTYPGEQSSGALTGGSHIGRGGLYENPFGTTYGSITRPQEAGAGASGGSPTIAGGGVIRISAADVIVNGAIRANGAERPGTQPSGAGGSIWITSTRVSGTGAIETNGGRAYHGIGGGGAISIEYADATGTLPALSSRTGENLGEARFGGAGSIFVKGPASAYGDLTIDNGGLSNRTSILPALGAGTAQGASAGATLVTDRAANIPEYFRGHWVRIVDAGGVTRGTWRIGTIAGKTITLVPNAAETIGVQPGDEWLGIYLLDNLKVRTSTLMSADPILVTNPIDKDGVSQVIVNQSAPQFPLATRAQIVVESTLAGDAVVGPTGAVIDPDPPIKLTAKNTRTLATFVANASGDGSFRVPVAGLPGDTFTIFATDSHTLPRTSSPIAVNGAMVDVGVQSVTFTPAQVIGGLGATGTVTLKSAAGQGGAVVTLSSDDTAATVPSTVTVLSGQLSTDFAVTTLAVASTVDVTVTATHRTGVTGTLHLLRDTVAPTVTITMPLSGAQFVEGSSIPIEATIEDNVGISQAFATLDGVSTNLTKNIALGPNVYSGTLGAPFVDGTGDVSKDIVVTGRDGSNNDATATVSVVIRQSNDGIAPIVSASCLSPGALYAVGDTIPLRVTARSPSGGALQRVEFIVTDPNSVETTHTATSIGNDEYEALYTVPNATDGDFYQVLARATSASDTTAELTSSFIAIANAVKLNGPVTIDATNASYEGMSVVIVTGTTTIDGSHTFGRLVVYSGATVVHSNGERLEVHANESFVACGGSIDATGRGYGPGQTNPASTLSFGAAGSHIGLASDASFGSGVSYGSVFHPNEPGSGAFEGASGGGVIRIVASALTMDGAIRANGGVEPGEAGHGGGAGGSIWITAGYLGGSGTLEVNGGSGCEGGGGGGVAVEYADSPGTLPSMTAQGGSATTGCNGLPGASGSTFVRSPDSNFGDLKIDGNAPTFAQTELHNLPSGYVESETNSGTLILNSGSVPASFVGHWVRVFSDTNAVRGTWRIASISGPALTLAPNDGETFSFHPGDYWQGVYRFDRLTLRNANVISSDLVESEEEIVYGRTTHEDVRTNILHVMPDAILEHGQGHRLDIRVDSLRVDKGGAIDATGMGGFPGFPNEEGAAGSHIGLSLYASPGTTYGNVYQPVDPGHGAFLGAAGGGVIRIVANTLDVVGAIRANGGADTSGPQNGGGAGGSIWITAGRAMGSGRVEVNGGKGCLAGGGGGALALEYTDPASQLRLDSFGGSSSCGHEPSAPGSVVVKGPGSTYGTLTVLASLQTTVATELPSLGSGVVWGASGSTFNIPFVPPGCTGHWVRIRDGAGVVRETWRIGAANTFSSTITLVPNGNEVVDVRNDDEWQGIYLFDGVSVNYANLMSLDTIETPNGLRMPNVVAPSSIAKKGAGFD